MVRKAPPYSVKSTPNPGFHSFVPEFCTGIEKNVMKNGLSDRKRYGRHEETRTPDLYRVKVAL
ncbi:MAG: hypothetical protein JWM08_263 [Candidatus Angelobacter sp.]|nr:hypothetical protein [Candidatus Angelobacter sp.]